MLDSSLIDLKGKRLGKWERAILLSCGVMGQRVGTPIRAEDGTRAQNVAVQRAAKNLEAVGLVVTRKLKRASVVFDKRLTLPIYEDGEFYRRVAPERVQWNDCLAGWLSPFGAGIRDEYMRELREQRPIRWTTERLMRAQSFATHDHLADPNLDIADLQETTRSFASVPPIDKTVEPIGPPGASENVVRWKSAIRIAVSELGAKGSLELWERSVEIFSSDEADSRLLQRDPRKATYKGRKTAKPGQLRRPHRELI